MRLAVLSIVAALLSLVAASALLWTIAAIVMAMQAIEADPTSGVAGGMAIGAAAAFALAALTGSLAAKAWRQRHG